MTVKQPRIFLGDYGDGYNGLKTSIYGNDVTVRADDFDATKRSFNSEWVDLTKIKMVGVVSSTPIPYQYHTYNTGGGAAILEQWYQGYYWQLPVIPLPMNYFPLWEERGYNSTSKIFLDDDQQYTSNTINLGLPDYPIWFTSQTANVGGRSWITTQATQNDTKNNTHHTPDGDYYSTTQYTPDYSIAQTYSAKCLIFDPNYFSSAAPTTPLYNRNFWTNSAGVPAGQMARGYPGFPVTPVSARSAYVMFSNKLGDWA